MLDRTILYSFYALFLLTPLIWTPFNFELFEYNKMIFVYLLTIVIVGTWLLKTINQKPALPAGRSLIINRSPLDIPILLFLGANILSTIFSIDPHTSIWGYYSRSNGGLLSIISYTLLYFAFTANINKDAALKVLKMGLWGGLVVSLWAILEHFGASPSCLILRGELSADCWVQDVEARVFATLGQPNWLAAYLGMLIFPTLYFLLTSTTTKSLTTNYLLLATYYLAFTFTYSRSGMLGFLVGLAVFIFLLVIPAKAGIQKSHGSLVKPGMTILGIFITINLLFGSALTGNFRLIQTGSAPNRPAITTQTQVGTQLESGGTESGQIRLIVWQGAIDIFKHYPILGSGVETFAYSYYQFRPTSHNLVSEWDFLYNKAHNEYLNYLANNGVVGFFSYIAIIAVFIIFSVKYLVLSKKLPTTNYLLLTALLTAFTANLVQNFFGFSVVATNLLFFLFPALAFVTSDSVSTFHLPSSKNHILSSIIYRRSFYAKSLQIFLLLTTAYLLLTTLRFWYADTLFAIGQRSEQAGNPGKAYNYLSDAVNTNPWESFYRSELGYSAASAALSLHEIDATLSGQLKDEAVAETEKILAASPKNVSYYRTAIRTYYQLSEIDPEFTQKTLEAIDKTISLAPTDPKLYYNKAVILGQVERNDEAIEELKKAIEIKPNYREAYFALSLFYFNEDRPLEAVETMQKVLQLIPNDQGAIDQLNEWGRQGISTRSGEPDR